MADTRGLLATRDAYNQAVEDGSTDKSHKDWYEENHRRQAAPSEALSEVPYNARWRNRPLTNEEK